MKQTFKAYLQLSIFATSFYTNLHYKPLLSLEKTHQFAALILLILVHIIR